MADKVKTLLVSQAGKDLCVVCSVVTEYDTNTNVLERENYLEGLGQLCVSCGKVDERDQDQSSDFGSPHW